MALFYSSNNLLDHLLREGGSELHILTESPPFMILQNQQVAVDSVQISEDNVAQLLYNMSTVDQMKELNACGDVQFLYLFRNWARFAVTASVAHDKCNIKIKNLGR